MTEAQRNAVLALAYNYHALASGLTGPSKAVVLEVSDALRAALAAPATVCGTCRHARTTNQADGWVWCRAKKEHWREDDGCLKGWTARPEGGSDGQ